MRFIFLFFFSIKAYACLQPTLANKNWNQDLDKLLNSYIANYQIPQASVLVLKENRIVHHKAYPTNKSTDAIYDLASISKVFTAMGIMKLVEDGVLSLDQKVVDIFSEFSDRKVTIENLLRHQSGLRAGVGSSVWTSNLDQTWRNILAIKPGHPYGKFKYSDVNYLLLGKIVEKYSGTDLDSYIHNEVLFPLKMDNSFYQGDQVRACQDRCTSTSRNRSLGQVHDPTSFKLGGVTGHAGLFSTTLDLARFAAGFISEKCTLPLKKQTLTKMITKIKTSDRGLGFDLLSPYARLPRGIYFNPGISFGHTGFTGTSLWIDPKMKVTLIILTNAVGAKDSKKAKKGFLKLLPEAANLVGKQFKQ
jgi:CubicO group peptidase (beta-lactamase class C family)